MQSQKVYEFKDLLDVGGASLVQKYGGSPVTVISSVYPEYEWLPWKFIKCSTNFWEDVNNQKKFVHWSAKELNIKEMIDWYKISSQVII
jgi:hypothetical protein